MFLFIFLFIFTDIPFNQHRNTLYLEKCFMFRYLCELLEKHLPLTGLIKKHSVIARFQKQLFLTQTGNTPG